MSAQRITVRFGRVGIFNFLAYRLAHPRRERKPEFKQERYPPLDGAFCSLSCLVQKRFDHSGSPYFLLSSSNSFAVNGPRATSLPFL